MVMHAMVRLCKARKSLCRVMNGYERHGTAIQGSAGLLTAMEGYVGLMYGYALLCKAMNGYARLCMAMPGYARHGTAV